MNTAEAAGYLFVVAAGNEGKDNDWFPTYPSHYDKTNVIAVTATNATDTLPSFANWGTRSVDLGAPGETIDSTVRGGSYGSASGTSLAAPFVAGAAALYWTANPSATHVQVRDEIFNTTDPLPALDGKSVTGGRLSIGNLFDPEASAPAAIGDLTVIDTTYRSVVIRFTATGDDGSTGTAARYDVRVSTSPITQANFGSATQLTGEPIPQAAGTLETFKLTGLASSTTYSIAVRALDNAANAGAISNVATFTTGRAAVLFDDNVEGGARSWTVAGTDGNGGPALWHIQQMGPESNVWSYTIGTYGYNTGVRNYGTLTSQEFDLAESRDARLRFRSQLWTERMFDADLGLVYLSVDGGPWTLLLARMFSEYGYLNESLDLSPYDGHRVRFRFSFDTIDAADNYLPGWQLDDFVLESTSTNAPPVANINGPYSATEDQPAALSASGSSDPEGSALEYKWSFGDGTFAYTTSTSVTHTWTHPGNYTVTLIAYDGKNVSDPVTTTVSPAPVNDRPVAVISMGFNSNPPPYAEETDVIISWFNSSDEEGSPLHCHWDFGDGTIVDEPCGYTYRHAWNRPGNYTITLIVNDGQLDSLPATQPVTIAETFNDKPIAAAGGPYDAHPNEAVTLDGSAASDEETTVASYLWTFPDGTSSTAMRPSKAFSTPGVKTTTLVVTDQTGLASQPATTQVRVCGGTQANLFGGPNYTCPGGTARVGVNVSNAILPLTLTWADGYTQTITSLSNGYYAERGVTPSQQTTYALSSVTDFLGCSGTAGSTTTTVEFASVTLSTYTVTACPGQPVSLNPTYRGNWPFTVTWSDGYVQTVNGGNVSRTVTPSQTTTYSIVSATCAACPAGTNAIVSGSVTVRITTPPVAVVSGGGTSCNGAQVPVNVTISGGEPPYQIDWSDGWSTSANGTTHTRYVSASATPYSITRIRSGMCDGTASGSATVTSGTRPSVVVSGGGTYCAGSTPPTVTATITGTAPFTLVWSDGFTQTVSTNTATRQPTASGVYSVTSITSNGCTGTSYQGAASVYRVEPTAVVSGGGEFCPGGGTAQIHAELNGPAPFTLVWSDGFTETISSNSSNRYVSPATATTYTLTSITSAYGCSGTSSGSATATPKQAPTATVSGGGNSCSGSLVTISAALTGVAPFTVQWSDGVTQTISSGNTATRQVAPSQTTTYTVFMVAAPCVGTSSGSATVTVVPKPTATVSGGGTYCEGATTTVTATLTGVAPFTVTWSDGFVQNVASGTSASRAVGPTATTVYTVTSLSDVRCSSGTSSGSATATPNPKPVITQQPQSKPVAWNTSTTINVVATGSGLSYQWYQGPSGTTTTPVGTNSSSFTTPKLKSTTSYWVKIWKTGCASYPTNSQTATLTVP